MNVFNLKEGQKNTLLREKFKVSEKTIKNYKRIENHFFVPPTGKHHLYSAMLDYMYLKNYNVFKNEDEEEESEPYNNLEVLLSNIESLKSNTKLLKTELTEDIKEAVNNSIKRDLDNLENILKELL
jgi:hypothetical protein